MIAICKVCDKTTEYKHYHPSNVDSCACGRLKIYDYDYYKQPKNNKRC